VFVTCFYDVDQGLIVLIYCIARQGVMICLKVLIRLQYVHVRTSLYVSLLITSQYAVDIIDHSESEIIAK